jgi:SAM-dependent methyltransferase
MNQNVSFYNQPDEQRYGREEMPDEKSMLENALSISGQSAVDATIVEIGCGKGTFSTIHPRYLGIDLSHYALKTYVGGGKGIQADAEKLPLGSGTVDFLFSFATLEHVPHPERAISEIERVLKPEGVALLYPAWFCRKWAAKALPVRKYSELTLRDKFEKLLLPLTELLPVRLAGVMPRRVVREARFKILSRPSNFDYVRLNPNLDEYVYTDGDAWSRMDSHACVMYFHSRGWSVLSAPSLLRRLAIRHEPVLVRKQPVSSHS